MARINPSSERVNLTASRVQSYQCEGDKAYTMLWDENCRSLALQATRNGNKSYIFQSRLHGKTIRKAIGSPREWTVPQAREVATEWKVMVDKGIDPREVAAATKAKSTAAALERSSRKQLAREAWNAYMEAPHPRWGERHRQEHIHSAQLGGTVPKIGKELTRAGPLASLLALPLHEITAEVVEAWLQKELLVRAGYAKNCLTKFRAFINWCLTQPAYKMAAHADCGKAKAVKDITPPNKTKPNDSLQKAQLPLWFEHVRRISNPVFSVYFQALLLTGARKGEMQKLKWSDIDFTWKKMEIRDKVNGRRTIPLTPHLESLLESLPKVNDYVFSSPSAKDGHITSEYKAHAAVLKRAGLPHISVNGLRRSFTSLSKWLRLEPDAVRHIMGHKPRGVDWKHYVQPDIEMLRLIHVEIEEYILANA